MDSPRGAPEAMAHTHLSVVIPVYNEEANLPLLFTRLYATLDQLSCSWECVFVDDGSKDRSVALLRTLYQQRPGNTRVIVFRRNFGQHAAIMAGFAAATGEVVITLDADLQNPPEEIPRLLAASDAGHDYVGTIRLGRQDHWARTLISRSINLLRERMTPIRITDQGCMLRAYSRHVIDAVNASREVNTFIPALAYLYARNPVEIEVAHEQRHAGQSKYSFYKLIRLNFDLMTGFTVMPLQLFSMLGMIVSGVSLVLFLYLIWDRIVHGPDVQGVFTLFAIVFFLLGLALFGIGLIGEYVGRTYEQVRGRPRYLIAAVLAPGEQADPERLRALETNRV
ncbi:MAG TPA: glycosyltransferase [Steroidobacteraceae bacterium]|nr:glycosyltransferase [Steroidobacteraceae bacterium]